jgi:hypothetical protein
MPIRGQGQLIFWFPEGHEMEDSNLGRVAIFQSAKQNFGAGVSATSVTERRKNCSIRWTFALSIETTKRDDRIGRCPLVRDDRKRDHDQPAECEAIGVVRPLRS